jgi:hypothetical protein
MTISPRLLFLSFLGLGLVTGLFVGSLSQAIAAGPNQDAKQHNVLVVIVDDLTAEHPTLQGIWLSARRADSSELSWMPIYPAPLEDGDNEYATPHAAFYLPSGEFTEVANLPPLRAEGAWWDEVYLLDEVALTMLQSASGLEAIAFTDTWAEPQRALFEQVQVLTAMCDHAAALAGQGGLDQALALMPSHLRTSINPFELITRWDDWSLSGFELTCTHPWAN